jgi:4-hydroxy 2-oxovalerate aldolase
MKVSISLIDCTLRDGGNLNNWHFSDQAVQRIIEGLESARVDYIEVGYRGGSSSNKAEHTGETAYCTQQFLESLPQTLHSRIAVMVVPSVCQLEQLDDLDPKLAAMVRLAAYPHDVDAVYPYISFLKERGFLVGMNLMAANYVEAEKIAEIAKKADERGADVFYIADSFGSMTPSSVGERIRAVGEVVGCCVGFHGHNNLGLAFANALEAIRSGATYIDTALCGMARGAGNLPTEQFVSALMHWGQFGTQYRVQPVLDVAEYVLTSLLRYPMRISSPEITCGLSDLHYYYYDLLIEYCKNLPLDVLEVGQALGKMHPSKVDISYIDQTIKHYQRNRRNSI